MGLNGYGEKKKKSKDFLLLLNYKVGTWYKIIPNEKEILLHCNSLYIVSFKKSLTYNSGRKIRKTWAITNQLFKTKYMHAIFDNDHFSVKKYTKVVFIHFQYLPNVEAGLDSGLWLSKVIPLVFWSKQRKLLIFVEWYISK
jgi:hypothetical protein